MAYRNDVDNYVYSIICPLSNNPVYIGVSSRPKERFWDHYSRAHNFYLHKWLHEMRNNGHVVNYSILQLVKAGEDVYKAEREWINKYISQDIKLFNSVIKGHKKNAGGLQGENHPVASIIQLDPETKKRLEERAKKLNLKTKAYIEKCLTILSVSINEPLKDINTYK